MFMYQSCIHFLNASDVNFSTGVFIDVEPVRSISSDFIMKMSLGSTFRGIEYFLSPRPGTKNSLFVKPMSMNAGKDILLYVSMVDAASRLSRALSRLICDFFNEFSYRFDSKERVDAGKQDGCLDLDFARQRFEFVNAQQDQVGLFEALLKTLCTADSVAYTEITELSVI